MFKKILWATDGSESADRSLPVVKDLATEAAAPVVVFHSDQRMVGPRAYGLSVDADPEEVKAKIQRQADELASDGVNVSVEIVSDIAQPAHDIATAAQKEGVDLIVVGTRGHTRLGGLLLGSVTQRLLQIAPCSVLVVPAARDAASA